jgi:Dyp-type peroxidase family
MPDVKPNLSNIQGNIFGGFNKDQQTMLFLHFVDPDKGRKWVGHIVDEIATSEDVMAFNNLFKKLKEHHGREGFVKATWTNIAFTHSGLKALKVSDSDLELFPKDFKDGMAARAHLIGDLGNSAPENWVGPLGSKDVHAVLIIASDSLADLNELVDGYINDPTFSAAARVVFRQEGRTRVDEPGNEHFGFKDGVSQPGIREVTKTAKDNQNKGPGGEDMLHPGEFVLGYPKQIPTPQEGEDGPNPKPGPTSESGPYWTKDGSYLVFRRLSQDVKAFRNSVQELAKAAGLDTAVMGAKLVGRYRSGAPLEKTEEQGKKGIDPTLKDPSIDDPELLKGEKINRFEYVEDPDGKIVPRAAHIRKAYPRDQKGGAGSSSESETQTHRLLRRGIPFGNSLGAPEHGDADEQFPHDRGLLFLAYQKSIEDQFEFVQSFWVNDPNFPCPSGKKDAGNVCPRDNMDPDGQDPIIAQSPTGDFSLPIKDSSGGCPVHKLSVQHFVTTTGGEYFFQPSIEALRMISR